MGHSTVQAMREAPAPFLPKALAVRPGVPAPTGTCVAPAPDRRADGRERTVSLSRDRVLIDRRVGGIAMRVAVPVSAYRGVALSLLDDAAGGLVYQLCLLHRDDDLSVPLDCAADDADILADWRLWSRFFRLPALVERHTGLIEDADPTLGGLMIGGGSSLRRPPRFRSKRRPAFLRRRRCGDAALSAASFAGEREIIARN